MDIEKYIANTSENKQIYMELLDKVKRAKKSFKDIYTDFLFPDSQEFLKQLCNEEGLHVSFIGGKGDFERAVGVISCYEDIDYNPVDVIKISCNFKFENLTHRDFLGAILSLGIKREKIGDINLYEDGAEIYVLKDISDYIVINLNKIRHTGVKIKKIDYEDARERVQQFSEKAVNVASMRLDAIVSGAINLSREKSSIFIKNGSVKLNYLICDDASKKVKEGDLISVKGYGRFLIDKITGTTKKDRITLIIKKFV
ncbi:RNA-binding protein [Caloramator sp. E03]|uniref:YlmH family RNA-binding protein n=1 Tax=Caloramator sp. E03 TaxID=2576307 RepID=UPI0011108030|nr:YlmH/Sll1252 family protein [Caloramator sp. E03]QCX32557.1 RNA-binding protein [Caloramator sp. E03]